MRSSALLLGIAVAVVGVGMFVSQFSDFNHYHLDVYFWRVMFAISFLPYPIAPNRPVHWKESVPISADECADTGTDTDTDTDTESKPPNIVLIIADDLGFNDITTYGGGFFDGAVPTPNIDSIAANGARFDNAYAGHATCAPSRAALMTGKFPTSFGYEFTPCGRACAYVLGSAHRPGSIHPSIYHAELNHNIDMSVMAIPDAELTIPKALKGLGAGRPKGGYHTVMLGKWHLGGKGENASHTLPLQQGFDETLMFPGEYLNLPESHPDVVNCHHLHNKFDALSYAGNRFAVQKDDGELFAPAEYLTDYLGGEAARAVEANKHNPFLVYLAFHAVHQPHQALQADYEDLKARVNVASVPVDKHMTHCELVYGAMIVSLDRAVGKVLTALRESEQEDNTIVAFVSDNGGTAGIKLPSINAPYRGWKATFFGGGIRSPLLLQWPARIPAGTVVRDALVSHIDIYPTLLRAAGATVPEGIQGQDLLPLVLDGSATDRQARHLYFRSAHYKAIVVRHGNASAAGEGAGMEWKYSESGRPVAQWLFDLSTDPLEKNNLVADPKYAPRLATMQTLLAEEDSRQASPIWPSRSETPLAIDKQVPSLAEDEYVYWPN